jgi:hypothetical protein
VASVRSALGRDRSGGVTVHLASVTIYCQDYEDFNKQVMQLALLGAVPYACVIRDLDYNLPECFKSGDVTIETPMGPVIVKRLYPR